MKNINFLIIGGSGHLCELNHYPAILTLASMGIKARVVAICDPQDPKLTDDTHYNGGRKNLNKILSSDKPIWINPAKYSKSELKQYLDQISKKNNINIAVIATNPVHHYFYLDWAIDAGISVLCDKPIVVTPDASWDIEKAKLIEKQFNLLHEKVNRAKITNPGFNLCVPLRRRALSPFLAMADNLQSVHEKTNEGITHITTVINSGIHRYPIEFLKGGAHGYLDGVGSLSHSSYHYLDVIAWYLSCAPGKIAKINISLPYVCRVSDYLGREGYGPLIGLNDESSKLVATDIRVSDRVLRSELDFTLHLTLYDKFDNKIGLISYTSNHTSFSPRTAKYSSEILDHANSKNGGRMSHIYFDIHQGVTQSLSLLKNDIVFKSSTIMTTRRLHPALGKEYTKTRFRDAYNSETTTLKDLFVFFVKQCAGLEVPSEQTKQLQTLQGQRLTHRIFSAAYELIAEDYLRPKNNDEVTIDIKEYLKD